MAKRYELSHEAYTVVADLFTEPHGRGRSRLCDRLMLDGVICAFCSGAVGATRASFGVRIKGA